MRNLHHSARSPRFPNSAFSGSGPKRLLRARRCPFLLRTRSRRLLTPWRRHSIDAPRLRPAQALLGPWDRAPQPNPRRPLSQRDEQIVIGIANGMFTKEIAARPGMSFKAVEEHRRRAMRKLDVHRLALVVRCAVRLGLVEL